MEDCNGFATEPLQPEVERSALPLRQEHSELLAELQGQQARHEKKVEQMLEKHLEYIAQLLSSDNLPSGYCSYAEQGAPYSSHAECRDDPDSQDGANYSPIVQEHAAMEQEEKLSNGSWLADKPADKPGDKQVVARSSWRPSVKSLTLLEETYTKDHCPDGDIPEPPQPCDCMGNLRSGKFQVIAQRITRVRAFEFGIQFLIISNGIVLGIQQDWAIRNLGQSPSPNFAIIEVFFAVAFLLELLLRILASGTTFLSCWNRDLKWNIFDLLLVSSAIMELLFKAFTEAIAFDVSAGRMLRLLRLVRVIRVLRVFRFFKDLRIMVLSITGSLRPLGFAILLLGNLIYITAVCFMQFVFDELVYLSSLERGQELESFKVLNQAYGSLAKASYTLFMSISGGVSWGEACTPLLDITPVLGVLFILYIAFAVFCVLNIITGIFVEEAAAITGADEENMLISELQRRRRFIQEAKRFFMEADKDGSGELSWPEFKERCEHVRFQKVLENLGIDVLACGVRNVFELFDFDGNGAIAINEFTSGLQQMRGPARSFDIVGLRYDQRMLRGELERLYESNREIVLFLRSLKPTLRPSGTTRPTARVEDDWVL